MRSFAPVAACAVLLLAGCATRPPVALSSPAPTPTPTVVATSATPTPSPSTVAPTPTLAAGFVLLDAARVGRFAFGAAEADVEALLTAGLGKPDDAFSGKVCELDANSAWGRQLQYGAVFILFESAAGKGRTAPRKLTSWIVQLGEPLPDNLGLAEALPVDTTYAELAERFPTGKLEEIELGESTVRVFTTPGGVWYRGEDATAPDALGSGPLQFCE